MSDLPDFSATIRMVEAEYRKAEIEAQQAITKRESLRKALEGLRAFAKSGETETETRLFNPTPTVRPPRPSRRNGKLPKGREAVRRVLIETRKPWRVPALAEEIASRGWMPGVKRRKEAVSATMQRLVQDGEVERVEHGLYRYSLDKLPPETEDSG